MAKPKEESGIERLRATPANTVMSELASDILKTIGTFFLKATTFLIGTSALIISLDFGNHILLLAIYFSFFVFLLFGRKPEIERVSAYNKLAYLLPLSVLLSYIATPAVQVALFIIVVLSTALLVLSVLDRPTVKIPTQVTKHLQASRLWLAAVTLLLSFFPIDLSIWRLEEALRSPSLQSASLAEQCGNITASKYLLACGLRLNLDKNADAIDKENGLRFTELALRYSRAKHAFRFMETYYATPVACMKQRAGRTAEALQLAQQYKLARELQWFKDGQNCNHK